MTAAADTGIRQISLVCVPTPDQDKAIAFYESLGFEKRTDTPFGGDYRWIEVYPPDGATGIALAPPRPGTPVTPMETGITLITGDIDGTHAALKSRGVDVDAEVARMGDPVPPMFWFRDPTGHSLMVVEQA
ncbi:MAG TPA: VOC family protein [Streptosporangiaceae bacterium]|nr:VOC family protein [Streptosporangiaceae bacterium]